MSRTYKQRCIEAKKAAGICFNCNLPAVVGMRRCEKHLDAASKYITDRGYRYRQEAETTAPRLSPLDRKLSALGRCKCGLLLPCVCLPSVYEVASNRRDAE
jgi:hypothetical protein